MKRQALTYAAVAFAAAALSAAATTTAMAKLDPPSRGPVGPQGASGVMGPVGPQGPEGNQGQPGKDATAQGCWNYTLPNTVTIGSSVICLGSRT